MSIIIWLLTFLLILDSLILMLLILIQLPKKEAGMGQAFGMGATDALFGAGSGTALTKMTKYAATGFFVLTLSISLLYGKQVRGRAGDPRSLLTPEDKLSLEPRAPAPGTNTAAAANNPGAAGTNGAIKLTSPNAATPKPATTNPATKTP
jgi:protein translocase SecG subunit